MHYNDLGDRTPSQNQVTDAGDPAEGPQSEQSLPTLSALMVCYQWPPTGGAGVQRVLKLTKYLPDFGVRPSVLTSANPSVPLTDTSLERDIRPGMEILRARTLEPGYAVKSATWEAAASSTPTRRARAKRAAISLARNLLFPDPQILWQPAAALALARRLLGSAHDDVVFVSAPPFSQFLSAPLRHLRPGTALVLDYRDEWTTLRESYEMQSRIGGVLGNSLESALLRQAHAVTTATEAFRNNLLDRFPFLAPAAVVAIPNGYDPDDYPQDLPALPKDKFVITYAGTIFNLTSAKGLIGGIRRLHTRSPELAKLLRVRFIGRIVDTEKQYFEDSESLGIEQTGYIPQGEVTRNLAASHMTLCLLADVETARAIYPAKIFELMYLGRPILVLAPNGALTELSERHQLGAVLAPTDEVGIAEFLATTLRSFQSGSYKMKSSPKNIEKYHRRSLAGEFAAVFRQARRLARVGEPRA